MSLVVNELIAFRSLIRFAVLGFDASCPTAFAPTTAFWFFFWYVGFIYSSVVCFVILFRSLSVGGSSSGSAAAVGAGFVPLAVGADGGGQFAAWYCFSFPDVWWLITWKIFVFVDQFVILLIFMLMCMLDSEIRFYCLFFISTSLIENLRWEMTFLQTQSCYWLFQCALPMTFSYIVLFQSIRGLVVGVRLCLSDVFGICVSSLDLLAMCCKFLVCLRHFCCTLLVYSLIRCWINFCLLWNCRIYPNHCSWSLAV